MSEIKLEQLLQKDFIEIIKSIKIEDNKINELNKLAATYDKLINQMDQFGNLEFRNNVTSDFIIKNYIASAKINNKTVSELEAYNFSTQMKKYYIDSNIKDNFYLNFGPNIKKINGHINVVDGARYRTTTSIEGNIEFCDPKNINKMVAKLVNINLCKGNNKFIEAWVIHCLFNCINPFTDGTEQVSRFILNNHINQGNLNNMYVDTTLFTNFDVYRNATVEFIVKHNYNTSCNMFINLLISSYMENIVLVKEYILKIQNLSAKLKEDTYLIKYFEPVISILFTPQIISKRQVYLTLNKSEKTNRKILLYMVQNNFLKEISANLYQAN